MRATIFTQRFKYFRGSATRIGAFDSRLVIGMGKKGANKLPGCSKIRQPMQDFCT